MVLLIAFSIILFILFLKVKLFLILESLKKLVRSKKDSIFSIKEELNLKKFQYHRNDDAFSHSRKSYNFSSNEKAGNKIPQEIDNTKLDFSKIDEVTYDQESTTELENSQQNQEAVEYEYNSSSNSSSDGYLSDENSNSLGIKNPDGININNININNTFYTCKLGKL